MKASSLKKFFTRLKMVYFNLIKYGSLEYVINFVDNEEKKDKSKKWKIIKIAISLFNNLFLFLI